MPDRNYTYAEIAIPGPTHLWAISVHMHTSPSSDHGIEANKMLRRFTASSRRATTWRSAETSTPTETSDPAIVALADDFVTSGPFPADQDGNHTTNDPRSKPEDYVLASNSLDPFDPRS